MQKTSHSFHIFWLAVCEASGLIKRLSCCSDTACRRRFNQHLYVSWHKLGLRKMTASLAQIDLTKQHWGTEPHQFFKHETRLRWAHPALCLDVAPAASSKRALWRAARRDWALSVPIKAPRPPSSPPTEGQRRFGCQLKNNWQPFFLMCHYTSSASFYLI